MTGLQHSHKTVQKYAVGGLYLRKIRKNIYKMLCESYLEAHHHKISALPYNIILFFKVGDPSAILFKSGRGRFVGVPLYGLSFFRVKGFKVCFLGNFGLLLVAFLVQSQSAFSRLLIILGSRRGIPTSIVKTNSSVLSLKSLQSSTDI